MADFEQRAATSPLPEALQGLAGRIRQCLDHMAPKKVILFGSHAYGIAGEDSDIDLIVVLDKEAIPATYKERMTNRLLVRRALDALNRKYALDLLVYTIPEWKEFQDLGSAFSREVTSRGIEL